MERERNTRDASSARERAEARKARGQERPVHRDQESPVQTPDERVLAASEGSFPASDPPGWIAGSATPCEERK